MASGSLDERFSLLRRRIQWRIADALHAIDKATGSTFERGILCQTLDRLGADGTCAFLNEEPVDVLERGINEHVVFLEERAAGRAELKLDVANEQIEEIRGVVKAQPQEGVIIAVRRAVGEREEIERRARHLWGLAKEEKFTQGIGGAMGWLMDAIDRSIADASTEETEPARANGTAL